MPTLYRGDGRTWLYVPYGQADAPTREAFNQKAARYGMLADGAPRRWSCGICGRESTLQEIGASFGDAAVGTPICPAEGCTGIGWEFFTEVPAASQ